MALPAEINWNSLSDSTNVYEIALDKVACGITICDLRQAEQPIVYSNKAFRHITGYSSEEILGKNITFLGSFDKPGEFLEMLRSKLSSDVPYKDVLQNFRKDRSPFWNEISVSAVRSCGELTHCVCTHADITSIHQADEEAQMLNHILEHKVKDRTQALEQAYDATLEGWGKALDIRDQETHGHTQRVTRMSMRLGEAMGMNEIELLHVRRGALLHDIGKIGIPDRVLLKRSKLNEEEVSTMQQHPGFAYQWLFPIEYLRPALAIPYSHHEKWDGTGYPCGLKEENIPLAARIFSVVDVWDALSSDRRYRKAWPAVRVIEHIQSLAGTHFDPHVVSTFLDLLRADLDEGDVDLELELIAA